jgi:phosphoesterase RecJ-like protein
LTTQTTHKIELQKLLQALQEAHSLIITTHREPDGDGLGAEAALAEALEQLGKSVRVINNDDVPRRLAFIERTTMFETYDASVHDEVIGHADALVIVDAPHPARTGRMENVVTCFEGTTVVIDHHPASGWAQIDYVDTTAAAASEIIDDVVAGLPVTMTATMAEALYVGIASDTQCFMTPNTTPDTHRRAARLLNAGASLEKIHQALWGSWSEGRLKLQGQFLQRLQLRADGRLVYGVITHNDLRRLDQAPADMEGLVNQALTIAGTDMAILVYESDDETVRLSLRSRNGVLVDELARSFGGGGHGRAAGATVLGTLNAVLPVVIAKAERVLN